MKFLDLILLYYKIIFFRQKTQQQKFNKNIFNQQFKNKLTKLKINQ